MPREVCIVQPDEAASVVTEAADLADGLRLADHFHAMSLGMRRSSVTAAETASASVVASNEHARQ